MIQIYAIRTEALPKREEALRMLLLSADAEKDRWERMREPIAAEHIGGLLLLQNALKAQGISPLGMCFCREENERPYLQGMKEKIDFNISHAKGLVVCAVATVNGENTPRIGIDAEKKGAVTEEAAARIVSRWFSDAEKAVYAESPTAEIFLRIWTGKEAMAKQTGEGLSGLTRCDTANLPANLQLTAYGWMDWTVTLCHEKGTEAAAKMILLDALR